MNYLIVCAHLDDELLGCGAFINNLKNSIDDNVSVCVLTSSAPTRESSEKLFSENKKSNEIIGIKKTFNGNYESLKLKDVDHFKVVRFIEECIVKSEPDIVITHSPSDLHNDHYITSICCQEAVRLPQRQIGYSKPIRKFMFMEVKSSTDWSLNNSIKRFAPNYYFPVNKEDIEFKIKSLLCYENVIRPMPYIRSKEALFAQAIERGAECGSEYAEAFEIVYSKEC